MKWLSGRVEAGDVLAYFSVNCGLSPFKMQNTADPYSTAHYKVAEVSTWGRVLILLLNSRQVCTAVCPMQPIHGLSQREVVTLWQQLAHKPHTSAEFCWHQTVVLVHELKMTLDHFKSENIFFCLLSLGILLGFFSFSFTKCKMPRAFFGRVHCINWTLLTFQQPTTCTVIMKQANFKSQNNDFCIKKV